MGIDAVRRGKLLYHLTKLENLNSILDHGLLPRKQAREKGMTFADVADPEIIDKRTKLGLDSYIPFHFHPYSSFDSAVKKTYCDEEFIYLCIQREFARRNKYKVLPRHPLTVEECRFYDYDTGFAAIDWVAMESKGTENDHVKHVKMAECLTELKILAKHLWCICVKSGATKLIVQNKLRERGIKTSPPYVNIQPWFNTNQ